MNQRALSKHSESTQSTQRALREYLKSNQKERDQSDFIIPSEPKILRLVNVINGTLTNIVFSMDILLTKGWI